MVEVGKGSLEVTYSYLPGSSRAIQSRLPSSTPRWWGRQGSVVSGIVGAIVRKQMLKIWPWVFPKAILHPVPVIQAFAPRQSLVIPTVRVTLQWKWKMEDVSGNSQTVTATSHTETPAHTWLPAGTYYCTLSRPEHASSLFREASARSDMSSSLIMKKCRLLIKKQCFKC